MAALLLAATWAQAAAPIFWTGPNTTYTQANDTSAADPIVAGVSLKRQYHEYLYNPAAGEGGPGATSPADTEWATATGATAADFTTCTNLTFAPFPTWVGGLPGARTFNKVDNIAAVLHLKNENIYISIKITYWGSLGQGLTAADVIYTRSTAAVAAPTPVISITNPVAGVFLVAPTNVSIGANATVSSGTVTNVQFFTNGISLGSVVAFPFTLTASNLAAGAYAIKAVATAAGISATSAVVNITVLGVPTVSITNPAGGTVFAAPANVSIGANASVSGGTVTNVQFFTNGVSLGTVVSAPFSLVASNLAAGTIALSAVATASGISATSAVVNVSAVNPVSVTISGLVRSSTTNFQFNYAANAGLRYIVQRSTNLLSTNWVTLATNTASANPANFADTNATTSPAYYRVGRLPNP